MTERTNLSLARCVPHSMELQVLAKALAVEVKRVRCSTESQGVTRLHLPLDKSPLRPTVGPCKIRPENEKDDGAPNR
jgi:hypothetical protein